MEIAVSLSRWNQMRIIFKLNFNVIHCNQYQGSQYHQCHCRKCHYHQYQWSLNCQWIVSELSVNCQWIVSVISVITTITNCHQSTDTLSLSWWPLSRARGQSTTRTLRTRQCIWPSGWTKSKAPQKYWIWFYKSRKIWDLTKPNQWRDERGSEKGWRLSQVRWTWKRNMIVDTFKENEIAGS